MQVLLVEGDPALAGLIQRGFFSEQINIEIAYDGSIGKRFLDRRKFDMVILEVSLSGIDGLELHNYVKANWPHIPVLMLVTPELSERVINSFGNEVDDYLVKPFNIQELVLKAKALARRQLSPDASELIMVADLVINLDTHFVSRAGQAIELSRREYDLLEFLVLNKDQIVGRADILKKVWDVHVDTSTNIIDVYITYLRKKVDKDHAVKLIHTVMGRGYVLREPTS